MKWKKGRHVHVEEHGWWSKHLNRDMTLKVYGHWGKPYIVFPCSRGRYFDYEGMGMIEALAGFIDAGKIKLFCVDSVDEESWYNYAVSPRERNARHEAYDRYIVQEVVPFIRHHCQSPQGRVMTNGCSMGAFHAVNFFLKHPDIFQGIIALSGLYRLDRTEFQLSALNLPGVYFNSPLELSVRFERSLVSGSVQTRNDHRVRGAGRLGGRSHRGHPISWIICSGKSPSRRWSTTGVMM